MIQYELALTRPMECGNAQLKLFNNIVANDPEWIKRTEEDKREAELDDRERSHKEKVKKAKSIGQSIHPTWVYHSHESDDREYMQDWFADQQTEYKTAPFHFRNYMVSNETGYTIRFGPERCVDVDGNGTAVDTVRLGVSSVGLTYDAYGRKINMFLEHVLNETIPVPRDTRTHLYTLELDPMSYAIYIDMELVSQGPLSENFEPPFFDEAEEKENMIDDPNDKRPMWWNDRLHGDWKPKKIPNPEVRDKWMPATDETGYLKWVPLFRWAAVGMGFEMYTRDAGFHVDNIIVSKGKVANAFAYARKSWRVKYEAQCEHDGDCPPMWWKQPPLLSDVIFATHAIVREAYINKLWSIRVNLVSRSQEEHPMDACIQKLTQLWITWMLDVLYNRSLQPEGRDTAAALYAATILVLLAAHYAAYVLAVRACAGIAALWLRLEDALCSSFARGAKSMMAKADGKAKKKQDAAAPSTPAPADADAAETPVAGPQPRRRLRTRRDA